MLRELRSVLLLTAVGLLLVAVSCDERRDRSARTEPRSGRSPAPGRGSDIAPKPADEVSNKPNVVLISIDTLRRDHLSMYGYGRQTSPNLQALADQGVIFDAAIAPHTNTAPSHASMLTGLYPTAHGIRRNGMKLRKGIPTLATVLKGAGFATAAFVSGWTLTKHTRLQRGFDVYDDAFTGGRRSALTTWKAARDWFRAKGRAGAPFFLFFHLFDPHYPYQPLAMDVLRFLPGKDRLITSGYRKDLPGLLTKARPRLTRAEMEEWVARYDGEIFYADRAVGMLWRELEALKARDRTLFVFTSDHGETLFERAWVLDHGGRAYDEQIRVPFVLRFPEGGNKTKGRIAAQVELLDIMPTVLDFLNVRVPAGVAGRSLLPLLDGGAAGTGPRPVFSHARPEPERVPEIRARLVTAGLISTVRLSTVKLIEYPMANGGWYQQLFDLAKDHEERVNLARRRPQLVQQLHGELERWRRFTGGDHRAPPPTLTPEVEERLRELGYVR